MVEDIQHTPKQLRRGKPIWHGLLWLEEHQFVVGAAARAILATQKKVHLSKMNPANVESNPVAVKNIS